jgi:ribosome maturation factor RimP
MGYELVKVRVTGDIKDKTVELVIAKLDDAAITVEDCAEATRQVVTILDVAEVLGQDGYHLEVSSPGINRPLTKLSHFANFIGSIVKLRLKSPKNGIRNYKGVIKAVTDERVTLSEVANVINKEVVVDLMQIREAELDYFATKELHEPKGKKALLNKKGEQR